VTNVLLTFVTIVTGVTNSKPITKLEFVIDAMAFIADSVMKWISAMIAGRWSVEAAHPCCRVNFVEEDCVLIVPQHVASVGLSCVHGIPNLPWNVTRAN
jgi:hypothetical protein